MVVERSKYTDTSAMCLLQEHALFPVGLVLELLRNVWPAAKHEILLLTSGDELFQRLGHDAFFDFALAINDLVRFAVMHFKDGDEVIRIARLDSLRSC